MAALVPLEVERDAPETALELVVATALVVAAGADVAAEVLVALTLPEALGLTLLLALLITLVLPALLVVPAALLVVAADAEALLPLVVVAVPQAARPTAPSSPVAAASSARRGYRLLR